MRNVHVCGVVFEEDFIAAGSPPLRSDPAAISVKPSEHCWHKSGILINFPFYGYERCCFCPARRRRQDKLVNGLSEPELFQALGHGPIPLIAEVVTCIDQYEGPERCSRSAGKCEVPTQKEIGDDGR